MDEKHMDARTQTVGSLIDKLHTIRNRKRELEEEIKILSDNYKQVEATLMGRLDAEGVSKSTGKHATASITEVVVCNPIDWEAAWKLIAKNPQLVQRRISDPAFREMYEQKGAKFMAKYGLEPFVKRNLNLRSL
jgi:hypothetical protein